MRISHLALLAFLCSPITQVIAQSIPSIVSPPIIPLPSNTITQGLTWTPAQWITGLGQKKDVITFFKSTTGAAAVQLTTDGNAATTTNVGSIPTGVTVEYAAQCLVKDEANQKANIYTVGSSGIANIAGTVAAATSNPSVTVGPVFSSGLTLGAVITFAADNTNKGWNISFTPPSGNTDKVTGQCTVELLVVN